MASMKVKTEPLDFESPYQVCRLCLRKDVLDDVFREEGLHQWISDYLSIEIKIEDGMSQAICAICRIRLTEFHQFRVRCQDVQGVLRSMMCRNKDVEAEMANCPSTTVGSSCDLQNNERYSFVVEEVKIETPSEDDMEISGELRNDTSAILSNEETDKMSYQNSATSRHNLIAEEDSSPGVVQQFQCSLCQKVMPTKIKLSIHHRNVHEPKKHVCHICKYRSASRRDLKRHMGSQLHLKNMKNPPKTKTIVKSQNYQALSNDEVIDLITGRRDLKRHLFSKVNLPKEEKISTPITVGNFVNGTAGILGQTIDAEPPLLEIKVEEPTITEEVELDLRVKLPTRTMF